MEAPDTTLAPFRTVSEGVFSETRPAKRFAFREMHGPTLSVTLLYNDPLGKAVAQR
jgi:hypothetical protein